MKLLCAVLKVAIGVVLQFPTTAAFAAEPEQLAQLDTTAREWQAEYHGSYDSEPSLEHSLELIRGMSEMLALGGEVDFEQSAGTVEFEKAGLFALVRFTNPNSRLSTGLMFSGSLDAKGAPAEAEVRFIAESVKDKWWAQGNLIARAVSRKVSGQLLAYSWNLSRSIGDQIWLGLEGSGQPAKLGGFHMGFERSHFVGPSAVAELPIADSELEIGGAYLRRVGNGAPQTTIRLFAQMKL